MDEPKKIAAIVTICFPRSHADVILPKFVTGFPSDHGLIKPKVQISSIYLDQVDDQDILVDLAKEHGIPMCRSIRSALTLDKLHWKRSNKKLAVDGVLLIGEHGDYGENEKGQSLYPRRCFFEQICGVFATSDRSVPVYSDKHLSYDWDNSKWMYDRARQLNVPFMAGSSLPLTYRRPMLEFELETPLEEAISIGWHDLDRYGFHALELLQCMVERRRGGETGIVAVQCLEGDDVWAAGRDGRWSRELGEAAEALIEPKMPGRMENNCPNPAVFLLEYADGFRAATLMLDGHHKGWAFAARNQGQVQACEFFLHDEDPHPHFSYLGLNIQEMFLTGVPPYPVERTLLVSGILDALLESRHRGHQRIETPYLNVAYKSYERPPIRPKGPRPIGASIAT